jgi:hypothetical protein
MSASGLPKVFLSYSYDGADHIAWVRQLATDLRQKGVDAILDQWDLSPGQDLAQFMERGLSEADRAIIVCTENYTKKANAGTGGVGYEKMIVTKELISNIATNKFIPIVRSNALRTAPTVMIPTPKRWRSLSGRSTRRRDTSSRLLDPTRSRQRLLSRRSLPSAT